MVRSIIATFVAPLLSASNVSKRYGSVQALQDVALEVYGGEVHAVIGENGAGKSTLVSVLAGFVRPDSGSSTLEGRPLPFGDPVAMRRLGVEMVHQHFMLVPNFTLAENLALAGVKQLAAKLDVEAITAGSRARAAELGWKIDWEAPTVTQSVGTQQRVEILKALATDAKVLVLDEPTAVLSQDEVDDLFEVLRDLAAKGIAVILIAHKLSDVLSIAHRVTVLRRGERVFSGLAAETDAGSLAALMVGERKPWQGRQSKGLGEVRLRVTGIDVLGDRGVRAVKGVSLEVAAGEILGIGGVDGNGQVELAEAVAGVRMPRAGAIDWLPDDAPRTGYIPQDRQADGLALTMSINDNLTVGGLRDKSLVSGPFFRTQGLKAWLNGLIEQYGIKTPSGRELASSLSGGNQQKVVVARVMSQRPDLIVAVNPTRGLDLRAAEFVHSQITSAADGGAAVLLISTDLDELETLANRILFLQNGTLSDHFLGGGS